MRLTNPALTQLLLILTLGATTLGAPGLASETWVYAQPPQPSPTPPTLKVYARETIVDVTVTDAKGNPVHGLKQEDFTLQEDGKPQPIRSFHEYATETEPPLPKLPPNIHTNLQPPPSGSAINILWLDFTNLAPVLDMSNPGILGETDLGYAMGRQRNTKQYAIKYLQSMPPGTRVAVFATSYPPGSLRVLQGITSDPSLLSAAIDAMPFDLDAMAHSADTWCEQQERRDRMTLESLKQIAADLAEIKGRKNLLWFTNLIWTLTSPAERPSCLSDPSVDLQKAYGLLAAAQVTVFPIGVRGVGPADVVIAPRVQPTSNDVPEDMLSMEAVAEATGGVAYYNNNDLGAYIAKAIAAGSDYYTLSYASPNTAFDGRHHTIKLVADVPNLHLTYRNSYYAEDPATIKPTPGLTLAATLPDSDTPDMKLAMSRSMPTSQQLLFDVQVDPSTLPAKPSDPAIFGTLDPAVKARLKGKPLTRCSFQYAIPALQIAFPRDPDAAPGAIRNGALEVDIAVFDDQGKLVTGLSQTIKMPLTSAQYRQFIKSPYQFTQQLDLPSGQLFLRIGVLDPTSGKLGTLEIPLTVPKK
jgi:VWFA-related protein